MLIRTDNLPWPLPPRLRHILQDSLDDIPVGSKVSIVFRDPDYSSCTGGFHPVTYRLGENGLLLSISDQAFTGRPPDSELVTEVCFDFVHGLFRHFGVEFPIRQGRAFFSQYLANFLAYHELGAYVVSTELAGEEEPCRTK